MPDVRPLRVTITLTPTRKGLFRHDVHLQVTADGVGFAPDDLYAIERIVGMALTRMIAASRGVRIKRGPYMIRDHG